MKRYKVLLFDADDTLLDFQANEHQALEVLFRHLRHPLDQRTRSLYNELNKRMWLDYENGGMAKEKLLNTRFRILFEQLGREVDGAAAESVYREALGRGAQLVDGALEVAGRLAQGYALYIVTNGIYETQMRRIEVSGLGGLVRGIFVSEKLGHLKPAKAFFDCIFPQIPEGGPDESLIVGDSLTSDMQGGVNAGIDTCWFNPGGRENDVPVPVTFQIGSLYDLLTLLPQPPQ